MGQKTFQYKIVESRTSAMRRAKHLGKKRRERQTEFWVSSSYSNNYKERRNTALKQKTEFRENK